MTPSLFKGTDTYDETSLSRLGQEYRRRITWHHETFITEKDFAWLKKQGIEAIRIPVGYWLFGDEPKLVSGKEQLDWAFLMAKKYNIHIFLSIHGAKGSQNGKKHSGKIGRATWYRDKSYILATLQFIEKLCKTYGANPRLWGIELLNEPHVPLWTIPRFLHFYKQACRIIRKHSHNKTRVIISDALWSWKAFWAIWSKRLDATLDVHYYHSFGHNRNKSAQDIINISSQSYRQIKRLSLWCPVVIGEWSIVMGKDKTHYNEYAQSQMRAYDRSDAWFYWSYKTEMPGTWNFRDCVERGVIKLI